MRIPFSSRRLRQRIATIYPCMLSLSRSSDDSPSQIGRAMKNLRSRSEENLAKLSDCMENMDEDVAKLFIECDQTDFHEDPESLRLLSQYFITSKGVTQLCESLRKSLDRAEHDECLLIDKLLRDFEEERKSYSGVLEASFRKTVSGLRNFSGLYNSGDDCDDDDDDCDFLSGDFLGKIHICHEDLANMIVDLEATMKEIDKKLRHVRGRRAIITAAVVAPVIAAVFVSKFIAGIFSSVPVEPVATFAASRWRKSTETLKREKRAMTIMEREALVALKEIEKIGRLVNRLEIVERSVRVTAEIAVKKRESVVAVMREMEKERKRLKLALVELEKETLRCDGLSQFGRTMAREKILDFLSHGEKSSSK